MRAKLYVGNRNYSSWSLRGSLLVRQSGLDCEEIVIPLDRDDSKARLAAVSPSGRVPVLHVDGMVVWDSLAIAEFLHERLPSAGLWPSETGARARARSVSAEMHSGFGALRSQMPLDVRTRHSVQRTPELVDDIARIDAIWSECRAAHGRGGEFLFGAWSAADAMYAPVVSRFRTYGVELSPVARAYAAAVWTWPALQALVAEAAAEPWSLELGLAPPVARQLTYAELVAGMAEIQRSPREHGSVAMIVRRPRAGEREILEAGDLDVDEGLVGDRWARGKRQRSNQVTLINSRRAALIAQTRDRWPLAGDQLYVDFDLSLEHLPVGSRVAIGSAEIEVSPEPHTGCRLFRERYGADALKLVNSPDGRAWQLRGINAWVVKSGRVRVGDDVRALFG